MLQLGHTDFVKTIPEKYEWVCFLEKIIMELEPEKIIVYGTMTGKIFDDIKLNQDFVFYDSWIAKRVKGVNCYGN